MRDLRIVWVAHGDANGLRDDPEVLCHHWSAGRRLRVGLPAKWLRSAGATQWLLSPPSADGLEQALRARPALVVVSGLYPNVDGRRDARSYFECVDAFRRAGIPIVVDLAENHFDDERAAEFRDMIERSDALVVNTRALADIVAEETGRESVVVGDPVEGARREPAFAPPALRSAVARLWPARAPGRPVRLLWFGAQARNYQYLQRRVPQLLALAPRIRIELALVAGPIDAIATDVERWNAGSADFRVRQALWSPQTLARELERCDLVLIPSDVGKRMAASTNRIAEATWAGRFVVANGLPSYWEFRHSAWIGEDLVEGLLWALRNRGEVVARIAKGQSHIESHYAPEVIGRAWREALAPMCAV